MGVVENMATIGLSMSALQNPLSGQRLVDEAGRDVTSDLLASLSAVAPELAQRLLRCTHQSNLFMPLPSADGPSENTPEGMARRFNVPYLGRLPMDPNLMHACEAGRAFVDSPEYAQSPARAPFAAVVGRIISSVSGTAEGDSSSSGAMEVPTN